MFSHLKTLAKFYTPALLSLLLVPAFLPAQTPQRRILPPGGNDATGASSAESTSPIEAVAARAAAPTVLPETHQIVVFADEGAGQVLDFLERLTGKIILRPQTLPQVRLSFDSRGPISREDTILAIESLLTLNGIMVTELSGRFLKASPAASVNQQVPELLVGRASDLPASQRIFAKVFRFEYLQAVSQAAPIIQPLLSGSAAVVNLEKSNALLITDALINLQRVETMLEDLDRAQPLRGELSFTRLQFVGADDMLRRLEALISGPLKSYLEGNTFLSADERTNQLIVLSPRSNLDLLQRIISSIDVDAAPMTRTEVFYMRQAQATAVVSLVESVISSQNTAQQAQQRAARAEQRGQRNQNDLAPQAQEGAGPAVEPAAPAPESVTTASLGGDAAPTLQFSSFVGLAADERTNSIVAYGTRSDLRTIRDLIEKIDIPLPQVRIEAIITEVTLSNNEAFGLERFGFTYNPAGAADITFGGPLAVANSGGGITGAGFDLGGSLRTFTLQGVIETAESTNDVRVLSTPSIVVSHNEEALINVSESRPIITGSTSDLSGGTFSRSTIQFRDIGINLRVTPLIGADGTVQMVVEQIVENVVDTTTIDGNIQPIIGRREARSTISVQDRDIIILGGLQENRRSFVDNRWPIVGRLPVVGRVFGGEREEVRRTELIIFIRPTILPNPATASTIARERLDLSTERAPIDQFLERGTLGNTYLEGTRLERLEPSPGPTVDVTND